VDLQHRWLGDQLVGQKEMAPSNQEPRRKTAMTNKIPQLVQVSANVNKDANASDVWEQLVYHIPLAITTKPQRCMGRICTGLEGSCVKDL